MPNLLDYVMAQQNPRMAGLLGPGGMVNSMQPNTAVPVRSSVSPMGGGAPAPSPAAPAQGQGALQKILGGLGTVFAGRNDPGMPSEQNAAIRNRALTMAGLSILASPGQGMQRIARGALVGNQVADAGRAEAAQKAQEQALMSAAPDVLKSMPDDQRAALTALLPGLPVAARQEILAGLALRQREVTTQKLSPGEVLAVQTPEGWQTVYQAPADAKPELDAMQIGVLGMMGVSGVTTQAELAALPVAQRSQFGALWDQIRRSTATQINSGNDPVQKAMIDMNMDAFKSAQERGFSAIEQLNTISQAEALLAETRQGKAETATLALRQIGAVFGLDQKQVSLQEALQAFSNKFALSARQNMPGQLSDNDIKFLKQSVIELGKRPEANWLLTAAARRIAEAQIAYQSEANRYVTEQGNPMGLVQHMAQYSAQNPLTFRDLVDEAKAGGVGVVGGGGDLFGDLGGR